MLIDEAINSYVATFFNEYDLKASSRENSYLHLNFNNFQFQRKRQRQRILGTTIYHKIGVEIDRLLDANEISKLSRINLRQSSLCDVINKSKQNEEQAFN